MCIDCLIFDIHLPLKVEKKQIEYKFQMESFDEIDEIIKLTFLSEENLKLNDFIKIIETKKSDVFLQVLCFLYYSKPFSNENINMLKVYKRKSTTGSNLNSSPSPINSPTRSPTKNLPSPNRKSIFSPVDQILKLNLVSEEEENSNSKEIITILKCNKRPMQVGLLFFKDRIKFKNPFH